MSTQPLFYPRFRALDANGNPLSGGFLYTYSAGTTSPLATYTTRAGTVANTNPVVLNSNGEADVWLQSGLLYHLVLLDSGSSLQWDVDNFPAPPDISTTTSDVGTPPGGRLTLFSSVPVPTADLTGKSLVYYLPYMSDQVPLWDGSTWTLQSIGSGLSNTSTDSFTNPAAAVANSNYDLFVWNDGGTLRLSRGPPWTSDSARGTGAGTTELVRIFGRYVNNNSIANGPGAQKGLYVGTVRTDASAQFNDSLSLRNVWNCHNRVRRPVRVTDTTAVWNSGTSNTWRQVRGAAANVIQMVRGMDEDVLDLYANLMVNSGAGGVATTGVGINTTSSTSATVFLDSTSWVSARYADLAGQGFVQAYWLELHSLTAAASAFQGIQTSGGATVAVSGMVGHMAS